MRRHSTGMMAGGIVLLAMVPVALLTSLVADSDQKACNGGNYFTSNGVVTAGTNCDRFDKTIYGGLIASLVFMGAGIPLVIIGGQKEPASTARISPWATPTAGGLALRLDL
jgi:hypothetical protein